MELEVREGEERVRLSRQSSNVVAAQPVAAAPAPIQTVNVPVKEASAPSSDAASAPNTDGHQVTSPMVGTFYRSASPGATPFIEVGQSIKAGDAVCIIEAMKMFNQIEADVSGKVIAILPEDGQPVEYGEPIVIIER